MFGLFKKKKMFTTTIFLEEEKDSFNLDSFIELKREDLSNLGIRYLSGYNFTYKGEGSFYFPYINGKFINRDLNVWFYGKELEPDYLVLW
jgi:hypothetical protein